MDNTTVDDVIASYEAIVSLGDQGDLGAHAARMRHDFQRRTGAYGPEDAWFESRARAFWDDALATQGFAKLAAPEVGRAAEALAGALARAHRGFFVVEDVDDGGAVLLDVWSGAELIVRRIDDTQRLSLEHAEGAMDARVAAMPGGELWLLPGAYHHPADALEPATDVLIAARERGMKTQDALDALMRMELVFRSSSRVKAGFAYRTLSLDAPLPK